MRIVVVTGLSGAGKSTALRALEDVGYFCTDNLPVPMIEAFAEVLQSAAYERGAISIDARQRDFLGSYSETLRNLRAAGNEVEVLFVDAPDAILSRRYSETRRLHPLSGDDVTAGIERDRELLAEVRDGARVIDTGSLNVHELRKIVADQFGVGKRTLSVALQSFGFKYGLPTDSDVVFDARFLPNPHFDENLRPHDGRNPEVRDYVFGSGEAQELVDRIVDFLSWAIPKFSQEGKHYLTVAVGCTGGRHRSVAVLEEIQKQLGERWTTVVRHRDVHRVGAGGTGGGR